MPNRLVRDVLPGLLGRVPHFRSSRVRSCQRAVDPEPNRTIHFDGNETLLLPAWCSTTKNPILNSSGENSRLKFQDTIKDDNVLVLLYFH